jgi:glycosyltransferase involved in cell wall biosynthesis
MCDSLPLISVVMPVYNAEKYLTEAIESILEQTYEYFEFIIINDGSTDSSSIIIDSYAEIDSRIRHVKNKNQGISLSLNDGINIAKGEFIARMDADDISLSTRFEEQVKFMENNPEIGVCGTWAKLIGDIKDGEYNRPPSNHDELKIRLLFSVCFVHPSVMMRRSLLIKTNNLYDPNFTSAQDYDLWSRLETHTNFSNIPKTLIKYRVLKNSVSALANNSKSEVRFNLISSVNNRFLNGLGIAPTDDESKRHYKLGLNSRLRPADYCLYTLLPYFNVIMQSNIKVHEFNEKKLKIYLAEKYAYAVIFKLKSSIKFSRYLLSSFFILGIYQVIKIHFIKKIRIK